MPVMRSAYNLDALRRLSVAERLELIDALWESVAAEAPDEAFPVTPELGAPASAPPVPVWLVLRRGWNRSGGRGRGPRGSASTPMAIDGSCQPAGGRVMRNEVKLLTIAVAITAGACARPMERIALLENRTTIDSGGVVLRGAHALPLDREKKGLMVALAPSYRRIGNSFEIVDSTGRDTVHITASAILADGREVMLSKPGFILNSDAQHSWFLWIGVPGEELDRSQVLGIRIRSSPAAAVDFVKWLAYDQRL